MNGFGWVFRRRGLFTLLALCVGLYVVLSVLPRRRRRAAEEAAAWASVRPESVAEPAAEPQPEAEAAAAVVVGGDEPPVFDEPTVFDEVQYSEPRVFGRPPVVHEPAVPEAAPDDVEPFYDDELSTEPEPVMVDVSSAFSERPDFELPPVAAIAGDTSSSRRAKSRAGTLLIPLTLIASLALVVAIPSRLAGHDI